MSSTPTSLGAVSRFVGVAIIWGCSFLFIKICLDGMGAVQVAFGRVLVGAVFLWIVLAVTRSPLPQRALHWFHLWVLGLFFCAVPFVLFSLAEQRIDSGLASIYNATTPLMTAVVALLAYRDDRMTLRRALGLALGFGGVVVVVSPWAQAGGESSWTGQLLCLGATACYGVATVYLRKYVTPLKLSPIVVAAGQVTAATVTLAVAMPHLIVRPIDLDGRVGLSMLALGALGSGLAYIWAVVVVNELGPTVGSTFTYLTPVVGVIAGIAVLGERPQWNQLLGGMVIVGGIVVLQAKFRRSAS